MKTLMEIFEVGAKSSKAVRVDKDAPIYNTLNEITDGNWTYEVARIGEHGDMRDIMIHLYVPGRMMIGVGFGKTTKEGVHDAIADAYEKMFMQGERSVMDIASQSPLFNSEVPEPIIENEVELEIEIPKVPINMEVPQEFMDNAISMDDMEFKTPQKFDEEKHRAELKAKEERDNATPIPGSNITQLQIDFMKDFKEYNNIDTDEKFDYYVKTWATHNAIDDIVTKKQLIEAGRDTLDRFITWIKTFQSALDNGIVSPV